MPPSPTLTPLLALYKVDRELHSLRVSLDNVQRDQKRQEAKIAELNRAIEAQDSANKKLQAEINIRDLDLKTRQQHIEKMRASLNNTKSNKEYSAILVQISAEKEEVRKVETGVLELMQQVETNTKTLDGLRTQLEAEKQVLARIESEQSAKVSGLQQQLAGLQARRNDAAKAVPAEALRQYDRVSQKYPGDALAPVNFDEDDLESVSCGACYMGLFIEHINALRGRDEIRRCNSCNRILYLPEMLDAAAPVTQSH